jgi:hypothetical protein
MAVIVKPFKAFFYTWALAPPRLSWARKATCSLACLRAYLWKIIIIYTTVVVAFVAYQWNLELARSTNPTWWKMFLAFIIPFAAGILTNFMAQWGSNPKEPIYEELANSLLKDMHLTLCRQQDCPRELEESNLSKIRNAPHSQTALDKAIAAIRRLMYCPGEVHAADDPNR